jgi:predicted glycoside hydrolase/deacetylase ChbG (UPF0249 family)
MIVNADDFGASRGLNAAILEAFRRGLCSSTTLMANQPATDEAACLARENRLAEHVGLHLTLDLGQPVTEEIRRCRRFCDAEGRLALRRRHAGIRLDGSEQQALAAEIRGQIARCRALGLPLTHVDSHHHVHTAWAIGSVLIRVAREEGIPHLRLAGNCGGGESPLGALHAWLYNRRLRRAGLAGVDYFGSAEQVLQRIRTSRSARAAERCEVMVHPRLRDGELVDATDGRPLEASLARIAGQREAVSYCGARYAP